MKIKGYMIKKALRCLGKYGIRETLVQVTEQLEMNRMPYDAWYRSRCITREEWEQQRERAKAWEKQPLVSICVPLYHTPEKYLCEMIDSVIAQSYPNWQLCLADGSADDTIEKLVQKHYSEEARICYRRLEKNLGIAGNTNAAFALAEGEWIGLLDHDDILAQEALYTMLEAAEEADVVYSDEDKVTEDLSRYFYPHFKPDYNVDLLRTNNYITHFFMVKRGIVEQIGGFRSAYDGAQDYDFIMRSIDHADGVAHVPRVLYHWRTSANSTADNPESKLYAYEAGRRVVADYLAEHGVRAEVTNTRSHGIYRVKYPVVGNPFITVCVIGTDTGHLQKVLKKGGCENLELIFLTEENDRKQKEKVAEAKGEYLAFVSGDIKDASEGWLAELLGHCQRPEVAAAGAMILDRRGRIMSAGRIIDMENTTGAAFAGMSGARYGYMHRAKEQMDYSALDSKCMLVRKDVFLQAGGFLSGLSVRASLTNLCFCLRQMGYLLVYTPYAKVKRGCRYPNGMPSLAVAELEYFYMRWAELYDRPDPCYNKNLALKEPGYYLPYETDQ